MDFASIRANLGERLPSAAAAIAVQAGLLALLVFSFEVVRHISEEKETILMLPPLARPAPARAPAAPGGRGAPPPAAAAPPSAALPAYARPGFQFSVPGGGTVTNRTVQELNRAIARCSVENYASLSPTERAACPPPDLVRRDPNVLPLTPDKPVKNEQVWKDDLARRNTPFTLPGGDIFGAALSLLFNPSVFGDKRAYGAPGPEAPPMDGAEMTRQYALHGSGCPELDDTTKRNCQHDRAALYEHSTGATLLPSHPHVSDTAFAQALAAVQARKQSLSAKPVLASGTKPGGGDEKNGSTGGAGAAAGGGTGPGR